MIQIGDYFVDLAVTEEHSFESDVTAHPVESGSDITDNVRAQPIVLTLECVVSDTPLGALAQRRETEGTTVPSRDAFAFLLSVRDAREPVPVVTSLKSYANMVLRSLSVPRSSDTGDALRFRVVFQQVTLVTNARTTVRVATPRNKKRISRGNKPAPEAGSDGTPGQSFRTDENASQLAQLRDGGNTYITSGVE